MDPVTLTPILYKVNKNPKRNVTYYPKNKKNKWRVLIERNKKVVFSSYYETEDEALKGRDAVLNALEQERLEKPDLSRPIIIYNL
jgi:hypothetical protein